MDERPVRWDQANRRHLVEDHPERHITLSEIEELMTNPERQEAADPKRPVIGTSAAAPRLDGSSLSLVSSTSTGGIPFTLM